MVWSAERARLRNAWARIKMALNADWLELNLIRNGGVYKETTMPSPSLTELKVHIYADGADKDGMLALYKNEHIKGFTTNPTLMNKAGVKDYRAFAKDILSVITDRSISFEVFTDDVAEMERQALEIKTWGKNVYVKIPITNTKSESCLPLVKKLSSQGVQLNVTAMLTVEQCEGACNAVKGGAPAIISVFAGRIADTGRDPIPLMKKCAAICRKVPTAALLWASTRELVNIFQADAVGCKIVTVPHDILKKLPGVGRDLTDLSLDTVKQFYKDATAAGYKL